MHWCYRLQTDLPPALCVRGHADATIREALGPLVLPSGVLSLTVIQGPDKGKSFRLPDNEPQLIGRSSEALPLTDNTVSRRHAEMTPDGQVWYVRDLGSQNGTWVNGARIVDRVRLRSGDQVRTGATLFVFGQTTDGSPADAIRLLRPEQVDTAVERTLPSSEDSVILAEPEPRQSAVKHLRVLYRLTELISKPMERQAFLEGVMDLVFAELAPERGCLLLTAEPAPTAPSGADSAGPGAAPSKDHPDRLSGLSHAVVRMGRPGRAGRTGRPAPRAEQMAVPRTILQHVLRRGEGVLSSNALNDPRFAAGDSIQRLAIRSAVCSPIRYGGRTMGFIYIDSSIANYTFTTDQLALLNAIGQHTGLALANADLHAQKLQGERLAAMGETVASLAHSIKNILQGLRGGADVVEMGLKREDLKIANGGWAILKRNLDRIISLTMNMLAYSRPRTLEIELVRLPALVEDCASLLRDQCAARQVELTVAAQEDLPPIPADQGQLHQALMNLLTNAVEAAPAKTGIVRIAVGFRPWPRAVGAAGPTPGGAGGHHAATPAGVMPGEARIQIADNGPGIAADRLARVFEPFFTTKGLRGTGLGLAVTRRIIEQHRGTIEVQSKPGNGATFTVILPVDPATNLDPSETAHSRGEGEPKRW